MPIVRTPLAAMSAMVLQTHELKANKLATVKKCLIEVLKHGGPFNPRDLYPVRAFPSSDAINYRSSSPSSIVSACLIPD